MIEVAVVVVPRSGGHRQVVADLDAVLRRDADDAPVHVTYQMPEMDGFEVCSRLKSSEATAGLPIIFVTARDEMTDETRGFDAGAIDYITKPIRPPVVRARVRTHLELKAARDLLEQLASIDALTGVANRRRFDVSLEQEWKRAARSGAWFSLAILDVDHFKKYNDAYGHARGDECLRSVAQAVASVARRPGDVAARYGGEEFALIFPSSDGAAMIGLLHHVLTAVHALNIEHAHSTCDRRVTVSVGAVSVIAAEDGSPARLLEAADRLLYEAKHDRNQAIHQDLVTGLTERIALAMETSQ